MPGTHAPSAAPRTKAVNNWFFALRPSAEAAKDLHAYADDLLTSCGMTGRRIAPERLHVTLAWLGHDLDANAVDLASRAADTLSLPALDVRFAAAMTFANPSGPFVLVGDLDLDAVRRAHVALTAALTSCAPETFIARTPFEPHMTLCYDPRHRMARFPIAPVGFHASEFHLVKSHIGLTRHEVLRSWPLRA